MERSNMKQQITKAYALLGAASLNLFFAANAFAASGTAMPWDNPLSQIKQSVTGPVATALATMIIVMCGLGLTVGEGSGGTRKLLWAGMGISITFGAVQLLATLGQANGIAF